MRNIVIVVLVIGLCVAAVVVYTCFIKEKEWVPFEYIDSTIPPYSCVYLLSPQYVNPLKSKTSKLETDKVAVLWNGKKIFSGNLPRCTSPIDGMPSSLGTITTSPGSHVLKIIHEDGRNQEIPVRIEKETKLYFLVLGKDKDGKTLLVQSLGSNPQFR